MPKKVKDEKLEQLLNENPYQTQLAKILGVTQPIGVTHGVTQSLLFFCEQTLKSCLAPNLFIHLIYIDFLSLAILLNTSYFLLFIDFQELYLY